MTRDYKGAALVAITASKAKPDADGCVRIRHDQIETFLEALKIADSTTLIEKLEGMKKKKCVGYCPSEHIQSAKIQGYNQALNDAIDTAKLTAEAVKND